MMTEPTREARKRANRRQRVAKHAAFYKFLTQTAQLQSYPGPSMCWPVYDNGVFLGYVPVYECDEVIECTMRRAPWEEYPQALRDRVVEYKGKLQTETSHD